LDDEVIGLVRSGEFLLAFTKKRALKEKGDHNMASFFCISLSD